MANTWTFSTCPKLDMTMNFVYSNKPQLTTCFASLVLYLVDNVCLLNVLRLKPLFVSLEANPGEREIHVRDDVNFNL